jgi:hypothetical protein
MHETLVEIFPEIKKIDSMKIDFYQSQNEMLIYMDNVHMNVEKHYFEQGEIPFNFM